ncbi:MAG: 2-succinyl-5-enolpyruvyl-6-hydroxy-3-cyclohexene-1-carboxylic-acid synthase [Streptococcaceae bacterium]|jgi:2-succinyl-5-enolpyruvyl-6-hydroxy-3-cyclohexene-1-carboxylate synthase|nr:2-succinyl-5-enolpyruvyl-6-hydroxy-3-cyclohexene-1-carboxylic-acid synthase [Streptococcaceae bacterium]
MYTEVKSYQIIIALLKEYGIKHLVLSAGSRNVPFVHSVEEDPYFTCYSVVDERSAAYFALGLSQELNQPVVISCTSSTATANYWPAVAEAFYQEVPLVVLTSDRNPAMLGQLEDQMIDQVGMYDRHVKKSVNLPVVEDSEDFYHCQRLVNEAFLELDHRGKGPVHINVPTKKYNNSFSVKQLPKVKKIIRLESLKQERLWQEKFKQLSESKRILVIAGQDSHPTEALQSTVAKFFKKFNCSITAEYMSNIEGDGVLNGTLPFEYRYITMKKFKEFLPDIVISFGGNHQTGIKDCLRYFAGDFEHWSIKEDGMVQDAYKSLSTIFETSADYFFDYMNKAASDEQCNTLAYHQAIADYSGKAVISDLPYSNIKAIKAVVENVPSHSNLHLAINTAIRVTNFFPLNPGVKTYANIGTHGIDGCLSSFLGQASVGEKLNYLIIGDLSFFYDMNALRIRHIGNNVRILMINNNGGEEFYYNKMYKNEASDLHTTARHSTTAKGWVESTQFKYLSATDDASLKEALQAFMTIESDAPIFLEVFTEMKTDSELLYQIYDQTRPRDIKSETIRKTKELIKKHIGQEKAQKMASIFKK